MPTRQPRLVHRPVFTRFYARVGRLMDAEVPEHRRRLLAGLHGRMVASATNASRTAAFSTSQPETLGGLESAR